MDGGFERTLERRLRTAGLIAGPGLALLVATVNPGGHPPEGRRLLAIITLAVCFWMTEAIPLPATALLASSLAIVTGVAPARAVLAPYADPVIFLFVGMFLLAEAFRKFGLDRELAGALLSRARFARSPAALMAGFGAASAAVSTVLSNTATAALMTPIAAGAAAPAAGRGAVPARWGSGVLLMVAYGASVGGMATLVGTPPNLLVAGFLERLAGVRVSFTGWLLFGVPIAAVLLLIAWAAASRVLAGGAGTIPAIPRREGAHDEPERAAGRRWTIAAFLLAAVLWTLPGAAALALGPGHEAAARLAGLLPEAAVALLCASLLFLAPIHRGRRAFALTWEEGRNVNWGIILLFGGGLSLGTLAESTGIARWAGQGIRDLPIASTPAGLLAVTVALTILVSEFASNTAAATLLVPVAIAAAEALGFDPVRPALGVGLAATCGFIFPVSTPPNAIVFGTGLVPLWRMIQVGILLDLASFLVVWLGLLLLTPLLPG
ncbi:MAG TPA: DASS family sodium-coupled anion symporter [Candidatus Polarisedimenticolia bacterium]|nr:DASS family sodium-coupled anion symporter [Candidatus Polarisedimenticolia bacterium]